MSAYLTKLTCRRKRRLSNGWLHFHTFAERFILIILLSLPLMVGAQSSSEEKTEEQQAEPTESEEAEEGTEEVPLVAEEGEITSLEQILASEISDREYEHTVRCIDNRKVKDYDVLNNRFVIAVMKNQDKYLIQLKRKCAGLRVGALLRFDSHRGNTARICANDYIRSSILEAPGRIEWGPPCRIPGFEPIEDAQIEQLRRGLQSQRVR